MAKLFDLVKVNTATTGTGTITFGTVTSAEFFTPGESGVADGDTVRYVILDGTNIEQGLGVIGSSVTTMTRTVVRSRIAGVAGTTKITLSGTAIVAFTASADDILQFDRAMAITAAQRSQGRANLAAAPNELRNISFAVSVASGALTVALKDVNGNDATTSSPITLNFTYGTTRPQASVTGALSIMVQSGATLGFSSNTAGRLWVTAWLHSGAIWLGLFNASDANNVYPLCEEVLSSSVDLVGGAVNSAGVHVTRGFAASGEPFRILGYIEWSSSGLATAGIWSLTNINYVQTFGPGVRKPGDVVARYQQAITNSSQTTTTSNSYVSTSLSKSPTLQSAANLVSAIASGSVQHNATSAGCWMRVLRGSATVGAENLTQNNAAAPNVAPTLVGGLDKPNSTAPTYTVQIKSNISGQTVLFPSVGSANLIIEEIQG